MRRVYISSAACISAQNTLDPNFLDVLSPELSQNIVYAQQPSYKDFIPPAQIRRMSKVVKMSTVASRYALEQANIEMPDAIIVGTGMGCTEDSEKFLRNVIQNHEDHLTPTNFIQSTHNTVAGQIALGLGCHAYNFTYVNSGSALECSLLDAKLQIETGEAENILVGAADETAQRTAELYQLVKIIKKQEDLPINITDSDTEGVIWGEGASFFVISGNENNALAAIRDIALMNSLDTEEIPDFIQDFLMKNGLGIEDIDTVMLGFSGDVKADKYHKAAGRVFARTQQIYHKHLSGEFNTASGVATFLATHILKNQQIPEVMKLNDMAPENIRYLLIYNNFMGKDHSLVLLEQV